MDKTCLWLLLAFPGVVQAQTMYRVINLDPGESGRSTAAVSVSDDRTVAVNEGFARAFRWTPTSRLNMLPPFVFVNDGASVGAGAGKDRLVVGRLTTNRSAAVVWDKYGTVKTIPYLPSFSSAQGKDINDAGQVCGYNTKNNSHMAFRYGTSLEALPPLIGTESVGTAINKFGWVAGDSGKTNEATATLWKSPTNAVLLGTLPGYLYSSTQDMNDLGEVVGYASGVAGGGARPFLWRQSTGMQPLESLGLTGFAFSNNESGKVVGDIVGMGAVLWEPDGTLVDLNSRLEVNSQDWRLGRATSINEWGDIVGNGTFEGESRAFLAVPYEEGTTTPTSIVELYGAIRRGDIYSLYVPNGDAVVVERYFVQTSDVIQVRISGSTKLKQLQSLAVKGRLAIKQGSPRRVFVELFNYLIGTYDAIDTLQMTVGTNELDFSLQGTGDLSRYLSSSGAIRARIKVRDGVRTTRSEQLVIDQFVWKIT